MTGATILEFPGSTEDNVHRFGQKIRVVLSPETLKVTRPTKCTTLRVSGLDDSVTSSEVVEALAKAGSITEESIRTGKVRRGPSDMGTAWHAEPYIP